MDIAVVMNWEENTDADIDLHGEIDGKKVWYGNKSMVDFILILIIQVIKQTKILK